MALPVLDFPASPAVGDRYPNPVVTGQPQYRWDGQVWLATDAAIDATDVSVGGDQTFTEAQKAQGRKNIYAAPFDAMAYSGMQINGSMEVSQEKGVGIGVASGYICDGWALSATSAATMNAAVITALGNFGAFTYNININPTVAGPATPAAGDHVDLYQKIEGYRIARLAFGTANAQPVTIAFWSRHNRVGTYSVGLRNGTGNRSYVTTYTQNVSDAAEFKTVTIPGDTGGTWVADNNNGMHVTFGMAAGTTFTTAPNAWVAGNFTAATGQVNAVQSTTDRFRITGVVVLPGIEAPSAARSPLIMRPYDQELVTCQRYYYRRDVGSKYMATLQADAPTAAIGFMFDFPVTMRSAPVVSYSAIGDFALLDSAGNPHVLTNAVFVATPDHVSTNPCTTSSGLVAGNASVLYGYTANAILKFDARL